jgi:DNA-binding MarR family transcriptional regulator
MTVQTDRQPIGFWLKLLDRLIETRLELSLGGLSRRHWQVLNVVRQGRAGQAEIDARVRPFIGSEGTTAREVADLQQRGWLTTGTAMLELTELGTNEFERLLTLVSADRTTLMIGITPDEYASTVSVLERMARNLGWTPREDRPHSPAGDNS